MTEEEIERAFYLVGSLQGVCQGIILSNKEFDEEVLDKTQQSYYEIIQFMKEGAKAIRQLRKIPECYQVEDKE